jgi:AraC-like DNA-binding protein
MFNPFIDPGRANSDDGPLVISVVSETAANRAAGRHAHARGQLLGTLDGLISIGTEAGRWIVPAVHAVWIPSHHPHELLSHGPFRGWSLYVAESACLVLPQAPCVICVGGLLREAVHRAAGWTDEILDERQERITAVILDEIAGAATGQFGLLMPSDPRLARIARALMADLAGRRRLEDWALWAAIPPRTLSRRFVVETGFSFSAWRQRARLMRALELLADGSAVTTAALDVGYDNISAFISLFRRTFGATPTRYFAADSARAPKDGTA